MQQCTVTVDHGFLSQRDPNIGWVAAQGFTEKSGRRDSNHSKGMALYDERRTYDRSLGAIGSLPDMMAEDSNGRSSRPIVIRRKHSPTESVHTER